MIGKSLIHLFLSQVLSAIRNNVAAGLANATTATRDRTRVICDVDTWRALFARIDNLGPAQTRRALGPVRDAVWRWVLGVNRRHIGPGGEWFRAAVAGPLRAGLGRLIEGGGDCLAGTYRGATGAVARTARRAWEGIYAFWSGRVVPRLRALDTAARAVVNSCGGPLGRGSLAVRTRCNAAANHLKSVWARDVTPKLQSLRQRCLAVADRNSVRMGNAINTFLTNAGHLINRAGAPFLACTRGTTNMLRRGGVAAAANIRRSRVAQSLSALIERALARNATGLEGEDLFSVRDDGRGPRGRYRGGPPQALGRMRTWAPERDETYGHTFGPDDIDYDYADGFEDLGRALTWGPPRGHDYDEDRAMGMTFRPEPLVRQRTWTTRDEPSPGTWA